MKERNKRKYRGVQMYILILMVCVCLGEVRFGIDYMGDKGDIDLKAWVNPTVHYDEVRINTWNEETEDSCLKGTLRGSGNVLYHNEGAPMDANENGDGDGEENRLIAVYCGRVQDTCMEILFFSTEPGKWDEEIRQRVNRAAAETEAWIGNYYLSAADGDSINCFDYAFSKDGKMQGILTTCFYFEKKEDDTFLEGAVADIWDVNGMVLLTARRRTKVNLDVKLDFAGEDQDILWYDPVGDGRDNMEWNDCSDTDQECAAWSFQDKDHNGGQSFARFRIEVAAYQEEKDALKANLSEDLSLSGHFTQDVY